MGYSLSVASRFASVDRQPDRSGRSGQFGAPPHRFITSLVLSGGSAHRPNRLVGPLILRKSIRCQHGTDVSTYTDTSQRRALDSDDAQVNLSVLMIVLNALKVDPSLM